MPIPNPVYSLMVPFLCVVTLPLAILAGITTTLAFSVLMFRVMVVYLDIAVSLVPQYLMGRNSTTTSENLQSQSTTSSTRQQHHHYTLEGNPHSPKSDGPGSPGHRTPPPLPVRGDLLTYSATGSGHRSPPRTTNPHPHAHFASAPASVMSPSAGRRSRRGSVGGASTAATSSVGTITPVREESTSQDTGNGAWSAGGNGPSSFVMLKESSQSGNGNAATVRDFEGVGGWRLASEGKNDDDDDDDSDWANINSRLELPLERMRQQQHQGGGHHYRTPSGHSGSVTPGGGEGSWLMMKGGRGSRGAEGGLSVATDVAEREGPAPNWGSGTGQHVTGAPSGRVSVSPNSSRVRIGQGIVSFTGVERNDGYFPPTGSPKTTRKAA
ncbi:hypothetical protein GE09DRAFT_1137056 [Coniochaeta sp. 2T2.1]|nr:hypothetical protein GE09DRAFT_1137056 [Coniochaeta sp. 2T2.1]